MRKYIIYFILALTIATLIGYFDNNLKLGILTGVGVGLVFALLNYLKII
ncbi:MAG: hypothetical protein RBT65_03340 [Methanolobus sp.]|jgi:uncharacterized membrane protein (UPF0136 family)|nr:hypothetical protein [Methanolobus sp.]